MNDYIEDMVTFTAWQKFIPPNIPAIQRYLGLAKFLSSKNFHVYGTSLSESTQTLGPATITYNPQETLKKFGHKKDPITDPEMDNNLLNEILTNIHVSRDIEAATHTAQHSKTDNITQVERKAIEFLKNNKDIVINKADKGSTIVVVNKNDCIEDGLKHLDDPKVYRKLKHDNTPLIFNKIMTFLTSISWQGWIPRPFVDYCTPPENYRTSQLYFLKKIHKNPIGIRPIVSSVNAVTEKISSFLDGWLTPLVQQLPSYIKDSTEFIKLITTAQIPLNSVLVSIDVSSLYTNIPHKDGIEACINALQTKMEPDPLHPPIEILAEMLNIVLKNNVVEFNGEFFLQLQGTVMGTKMAPAYANLFMGTLKPRLQNLGLLRTQTYGNVSSMTYLSSG